MREGISQEKRMKCMEKCLLKEGDDGKEWKGVVYGGKRERFDVGN